MLSIENAKMYHVFKVEHFECHNGPMRNYTVIS